MKQTNRSVAVPEMRCQDGWAGAKSLGSHLPRVLTSWGGSFPRHLHTSRRPPAKRHVLFPIVIYRPIIVRVEQPKARGANASRRNDTVSNTHTHAPHPKKGEKERNDDDDGRGWCVGFQEGRKEMTPTIGPEKREGTKGKGEGCT